MSATPADRARCDEAVAVGLAVAVRDLGVGPAHHQVARLQVAQPDHGVDRPLDALPRPDQSPGEDERAAAGSALRRGAACPWSTAPCGITTTCAGSAP